MENRQIIISNEEYVVKREPTREENEAASCVKSMWQINKNIKNRGRERNLSALLRNIVLCPMSVRIDDYEKMLKRRESAAYALL